MAQAQYNESSPESSTDLQTFVSSFLVRIIDIYIYTIFFLKAFIGLALLESHVDVLDSEPYYDADNPEPVTDEQLEQVACCLDVVFSTVQCR